MRWFNPHGWRGACEEHSHQSLDKPSTSGPSHGTVMGTSGSGIHLEGGRGPWLRWGELTMSGHPPLGIWHGGVGTTNIVPGWKEKREAGRWRKSFLFSSIGSLSSGKCSRGLSRSQLGTVPELSHSFLGGSMQKEARCPSLTGKGCKGRGRVDDTIEKKLAPREEEALCGQSPQLGVRRAEFSAELCQQPSV